MKEKNQQKKENKIITVIIGLFPGFIAGVVIISLLKWFFHDLSDALFILAAVCCIVTAVFALVLGIAIHEAGHLIFGLMTGYKFSSYRIFSLMWIKDENNKIKLKRFKLYRKDKDFKREIDKFYLKSLQNKVNMIKFKHSILFGKPII